MLTVPLAHLLMLYRLRNRVKAWHPAYAFLSGMSFMVSGVFALLYLPFTPIAALGLMYFGAGLIPLTPLISVFTGIGLLRIIKKAGIPRAKTWVVSGMATACLAMAVVQGPQLLTRYGLSLAGSSNNEKAQRGIRFLRQWGNKKAMLHACYWQGGEFDMDWSLWDSVSTADARTIFYRVTGEPFNRFDAPVEQESLTFRSRSNWDWDQGREVVGQRVQDLALDASRMDGRLYADAGLGYIEWTMLFKNTGLTQKEARAQIALPEGGMISRLTLWVNGEPREAAFAGKSQVRKAYQEIAIRQRRDPVLVTSSGTDRVLMQCFPVPVEGEMKIRMGMTFPLHMTEASEGRFRLPRIIEENFEIDQTLEHHVWIESDRDVMVKGRPIESSGKPTPRFKAALTTEDLNHPKLAIHAVRNPEVNQVWCEDPFEKGRWITGAISATATSTSNLASNWLVVIDGSKAMRAYQADIYAALQASTNRITGIILATDKPQRMSLEEFGQVNFKRNGGEDNLPGLIQAFDASLEEPVKVLWIHGIQAMRLSDMQPLEQTWGFKPNLAEIYTYGVADGPNVVLRDMEGKLKITHVPSFGDITSDLLNGLEPGRVLSLQTTSTHTPPTAGETTNGHLARMWAFGEVNRILTAPGRKWGSAVTVASTYQLVTAVSGAVVLETDAQYKQNGLDPADPASVPTIPEPETWLLFGLLALGCGGSALRKWRAQRVA
ncbi:MAG: hypothetical protein ACI9QL_004742 [Candidatus Omnitrophota bacterium]